ncbi:MAG TPA: response regulator [Armatimonadetes bacterium]|nr:response regulator [Armatimonadota bacterium]
MPGEKILVVDDEELVRTACVGMLEGLGYQAVAVASGEEALALARQQKFDLALLDNIMPGLSGLETFTALQELDDEIVGVMITGYGTLEVAIEAIQRGFAGFLLKPLDEVARLQAVVEQALARRRLMVENARLRALASLNQAGEQIIATTDLGELLELALRIALREVEAEAGSLMLVDPERRELTIKASVGLSPEVVATARVPLGQPIAGCVATIPRAVCLQPDSPDYERFAAHCQREEIAAALNVRLFVGRGVIGVLNLNKLRAGTRFSSADAELVVALARLVAAAIERLQGEEEKSRQERLASIGRAASSIMHDLRGPLTAILGAAELIAEHAPHTTRYTDIIQAEVDRATDMANELLLYARGTTDLQPARHSAGEFLQETAAFLQRELEGTNIELETVLEFTGEVSMDARKIQRALFNLTSNAQEAMPHGGTLTLGARQVEKWVEFYVRDTGYGMSPEVRERCFEPFFSTKLHGTGLGLAIVQGIVAAHGGEVQVESEEGMGTTFTLRLPL